MPDNRPIVSTRGSAVSTVARAIFRPPSSSRSSTSATTGGSPTGRAARGDPFTYALDRRVPRVPGREDARRRLQLDRGGRDLRRRGGPSRPVVGVIDPGTPAAVHATRNGRVGMIGTIATARKRRLRARRHVRLSSRACPVFVECFERRAAGGRGKVSCAATRRRNRHVDPGMHALPDAGRISVVMGDDVVSSLPPRRRRRTSTRRPRPAPRGSSRSAGARLRVTRRSSRRSQAPRAEARTSARWKCR